MTEQQAEEGDKGHTKTFTRREIREYSGWSDFQVKTHIKQLEELEYIYSVTGRKAKSMSTNCSTPAAVKTANPL